MYRIYGTINGFRNCDTTFTHGALILLEQEGVCKKLRLFMSVDPMGELRARVTDVAGCPGFGFEHIARPDRAVFYWSDIEDVLSGMNPHKAGAGLSGREFEEFFELTRILGVIDRKERADREWRSFVPVRPPRSVGPPRLRAV